MCIKPNDQLTGSALACAHPKPSAVRLNIRELVLGLTLIVKIAKL